MITARLKTQAIATIVGTLSLMLVLSPLFVKESIPINEHEQLLIRKVTITAPPPPPPPPPKSSYRKAETTPIAIKVQGGGPTIPIIDIEPNIDMLPPSVPVANLTAVQWQSLEIDWQAFELNALDALPSLVNTVKLSFPRSLTSMGVDKALVQLDVLIDEQGRLTLINIVKNKYPELVEEIYKFIRRSRFSSPLKNGSPVKARFILPLEIEP